MVPIKFLSILIILILSILLAWMSLKRILVFWTSILITSSLLVNIDST